VPVIPQTIFRIGSVTKQFTASAILKLQEEGKLSINDKLSKYIPDFPRANEVTLRQLLTHTSGIQDCRMTADFLSRVTQPTTTETTIEELKRQTHPYDFNPGTKWRYNNAGYLLLCYIMEKVSGQNYGDFLRENFFQPLGMTNTGVYCAHLGLPHEALGYSLDTNSFKRAANWDMSWATGSGALYSTVEDLHRWNEGIFNGRVLHAASLKAAFIPVKMGENQVNSDSGYGFGWVIGRHRGLREISHGGGLHGFESDLVRVPDEKFTVAVLANAALPGKPNASPGLLAQQLVDIFLADKLAPLPIVNTNVSSNSYDGLTGSYDIDLGVKGEMLTISRQGTRLFDQAGKAPEEEIFPKNDTEFFSKTDTQITFVKDSSGKVFKVLLHTLDGLDLVASPVNDTEGH